MELRVEHLPGRKGDVRDSLADILKAKKAFGWSPGWTLEQGIREAAERSGSGGRLGRLIGAKARASVIWGIHCNGY